MCHSEPCIAIGDLEIKGLKVKKELRFAATTEYTSTDPHFNLSKQDKER
ncbi:MAG: hypothetical protein ACTS7E_00750 [Arsenophonus sp. NC-CH8-MAG3]